jgi:membrane-associated phospholipid phosphatase
MMLEGLHALDVSLMLRINREWVNPWLDHLLPTLSSFAAWLPLLLLAAAFCVWRGGFHTRAFVICLVLAVLCNEGLVSGPLKKIVGRVRPSDTLQEVMKRTLPQTTPEILALFQLPELVPGNPAAPGTRGHSFPSSHTSNLFAAAAVACRFLRRHGLWFVLLAALVGWSRIYCGVHWPSDVLGSAILGWITGSLVCGGLNLLWRKHGGHWFAALHERHPELIARASTPAA